MKQKDYLLIAIIVFFGAVVAFGITTFFVGGEKAVQKVEIVEAISAKFPTPDKNYFNATSFNPTLIIDIAENKNETPFNE